MRVFGMIKTFRLKDAIIFITVAPRTCWIYGSRVIPHKQRIALTAECRGCSSPDRDTQRHRYREPAPFKKFSYRRKSLARLPTCDHIVPSSSHTASSRSVNSASILFPVCLIYCHLSAQPLQGLAQHYTRQLKIWSMAPTPCGSSSWTFWVQHKQKPRV